MGPSIHFQDVVIEMFDAQTQASDSNFANGAKLVVGQRARFALECDLLSLIPWQESLHSIGQKTQLLR